MEQARESERDGENGKKKAGAGYIFTERSEVGDFVYVVLERERERDCVRGSRWMQ